MISELLSKKNFFSFWLSKKRKNSRYRWRPQQTKKLDNTNLGGLRSCSSGLFPQTFYLIISSGVCAGGLGSYVKKTRLSWSHEVARLHNTRTCVPLFFVLSFLPKTERKGIHTCVRLLPLIYLGKTTAIPVSHTLPVKFGSVKLVNGRASGRLVGFLAHFNQTSFACDLKKKFHSKTVIECA